MNFRNESSTLNPEGRGIVFPHFSSERSQSKDNGRLTDIFITCQNFIAIIQTHSAAPADPGLWWGSAAAAPRRPSLSLAYFPKLVRAFRPPPIVRRGLNGDNYSSDRFVVFSPFLKSCSMGGEEPIGCRTRYRDFFLNCHLAHFFLN